jgi:hypothetical protein
VFPPLFSTPEDKGDPWGAHLYQRTLSTTRTGYEDQTRDSYKGPDAYRFAIPVDTVPPRNSHNENQL